MEEKKPQKAEDLTSEALGLMLPQLYETLVNIQNEIRVITTELTRRKDEDGEGTVA